MEPFPSIEDRRRLTLSNRISIDDSSNLRDLLMDHQEDDDSDAALRRHALVSHKTKTLATVLACEKRNDQSSSSSPSSSASTTSNATRTLLDIIRNEDDPKCLIIGASSNDITGGTYRIRWKSLKDRFRPRRASSILSSTAEDPSSSSRSSTIDAAPVNSSSSSPRITASDPRNPSRESTRTSAAAVTISTAAGPSVADEPIRISLMALLEQTDRMGGPIEGHTSTLAAAMVGTVEEEEDNDEEGKESPAEEATSAVEKGMFVCCVCMIRHKGAAFIPCGHTFCRLCSRELWISRGNCPLCNGFILEILDIF